jgi:hypothetical protein
VIDAGGPLMNLLLATLLLIVLPVGRRAAPALRLLLVLSFAFNLFWASGQMLYSAVLNRDDWMFVLRGWAPEQIWRPGLIVLGAGLYFFAWRVLCEELRSFSAPNDARRARRISIVSYLVPAALACAAASLYRLDQLTAIRELALQTLAINAGLLLALRPPRLAGGPTLLAAAVNAKPTWLVGAACAYVCFAVFLCRGI